MMTRRIKALSLGLVTVISVFAFLGGVDMNIYSSEYEKAVALMKAEAASAVSSTAFSAESASITPGEALDTSLLENLEIPESALSDITSLQYYYETDNYAYGITADGNEVIALRKANGQKYDMLKGAGKAHIVSSLSGDSRAQITNTTVKSFTEGSDENGNKTLTVNYNVTGLAVTEYEKATVEGEAWVEPAVSVVYTLYENSIYVKGNFAGQSEKFTLSGSRSKLNREYSQGYDHNKEWVKVNSQWIYPENLDEPYQDFESLAYIYSPDDVHKMYTFLRGDGLAKSYPSKELRGSSLTLDFEDGNIINGTYSYSLCFVDAESEEQNPDYLGLFRSRNDDFAAGIAMAQENTERSTVVEGNSVKLNINVTNLKNSDTTFSLRYDVRNYYGDVVDAGLFIDNTLPKNGEANRLLNISGKYGMYYLNLYVITENTTYKECYPFALIEDYDYAYNETSPFGISTVTAYIGAEKRSMDTGVFVQDYSQIQDLANLSAKIGISNARTATGGSYVNNKDGSVTYSESIPKYVEYMQELGVNRFIAQQGQTFESLYRDELEEIYNGPQKPKEPDKPYESSYSDDEAYQTAVEKYNTAYSEYLTELDSYNTEFEAYKQTDDYNTYIAKCEELRAEFAKQVKASADSASKFAQAIEYGNEMNIFILKGTDDETVNSLYDKFYEDTYLPSYTYVTENYSDFKYIPTSFSAAEYNWISRLADTEKGNAIWDKFDICSIHIYGQPWMPDSFGAQKGGSSNLWNIEDAMIRIENACEKYGDKEIYVTETGYATPPEVKDAVGLRTQADYTARIGAICLGHGVDVIQYYCMTDKVSNRNGFNNGDSEYNFGLFYEPDFFEVIKPKPAGIAYANMTRQLESYVHNSGKIDSYDEGNLEDGTYSYNIAGVRAFRFDTALYGEVVMAYSNSEVLSNGKKNALAEANMRTANLTWNSQWYEVDETEFTAMEDTVRVVDIMGNETVYTPDENGKVTVPLTGSPVYIYGI